MNFCNSNSQTFSYVAHNVHSSPKASWTLSQVAAAVIILLAVYFPFAITQYYRYVPKPDPPRHLDLTGPFRKLDGQIYLALLPHLHDIADFEKLPTRSTLTLYEDGRPLGPAHSVGKIASGSYSHLRGFGLFFSASDNSDPNTNGRSYTVTW